MNDFRRNNSYGGGGGKKFGGSRDFRGGQDSRGFDKPQLYKATCAKCGNACEVPFKPNGSRPIYCRDCFKKDGAAEQPRRFETRDSGRPSFDQKPMFTATCDSCGSTCEVPFRPTGDRPVYCRACFGKNAPAQKSGAPTAPARNDNQLAEQLKAMNAKLDALVKALVPAAPAAAKTEAPAKAAPAAKKPAKKKASAKKKK